MKVLLGKKLNMTQVFREDGSVIPVTLIQAGPCTVIRLRENENGQKSVTLGFGIKKNIAKPQKEDWGDLGSFALLKEFPVNSEEELERGKSLNVDVFETGDKICIVGVSKGKGFQGVVRRHGFHGSPKSHGHKDQLRMPGSIGSGGPQRVFKGTRMAGRMGGDRVTVKNLEIVEIDSENNTIAIKGAVPGARGSFVTIMSTEGNVWRK
ncbi:50S ribosomal protein L3 [Patescibacteria group bacterium]|nr:50S ribosomal protein L3 [Patescibacteria group bacterium]